MNAPIRSILAAVATLSATGCMTPYHLKPGAPSATIELNRGSTAWICADTPPQLLVRSPDGVVRIPAGKRVTIGANAVVGGSYGGAYSVTYTCSASTSIVPEEGAAYYQDFESEGNQCRALVFRKTDDKRIGLAFDPTFGRGGPACVAR